MSSFKINFINKDPDRGRTFQIVNNLDSTGNLQPVIWKQTEIADKNGGHREIMWTVHYAVATVEQSADPDGTTYTGGTSAEVDPFKNPASGVAMKYWAPDGRADGRQWDVDASVQTHPQQVCMVNQTATIPGANKAGEYLGITVQGDLVATTIDRIRGDEHVLATIVPKYFVRHWNSNVLTGKQIPGDSMGDWTPVTFENGKNMATAVYDGSNISVTYDYLKLLVYPNALLLRADRDVVLRDPVRIAILVFVTGMTAAALITVLNGGSVAATLGAKGVAFICKPKPSAAVQVEDVQGRGDEPVEVDLTIHDPKSITVQQVEGIFNDAIKKSKPSADPHWSTLRSSTLKLYRPTGSGTPPSGDATEGNTSSLISNLSTGGIPNKEQIDELRRLLNSLQGQQSSYNSDEKRPW